MKPLLAHIHEPHRVTYPCYVQPKLNGIRALYQNGSFQSRDQLPFTKGLLDHLAKPLQETFAPDIILDGELYVHGWPLQRINAAVTPVRQHPTEDTVKVEYHVFDLVKFDGCFESRQLTAETWWNAKGKHLTDQVRFVYTAKAPTESMANDFYASFVANGYEGMMYRLGDCPYTVPKQESYPEGMLRNSKLCSRFLSDKDNRAWHLLKRKDWQDDEFTCVEVVEGEGKLQGTLGALICFANDKGAHLRFIANHTADDYCKASKFNVGSGLTDSQRDFYWRNPPIGKMIKVKYLCLSSDGIPLNPTIHPDHEVK